jgi:hypothetical protein
MKNAIWYDPTHEWRFGYNLSIFFDNEAHINLMLLLLLDYRQTPSILLSMKIKIKKKHLIFLMCSNSKLDLISHPRFSNHSTKNKLTITVCQLKSYNFSHQLMTNKHFRDIPYQWCNHNFLQQSLRHQNHMTQKIRFVIQQHVFPS